MDELRKKVINALENCLRVPKCQDCYWEECEEPDCKKVELPYKLAYIAMEKLKAQEPRVMTLGELKNSSDCPCWFESHGTYMGRKGFWIIPYMFSVTGMMSYVFPLMQTDERGNTHYSELGTYVYGKVWRCWTSRPTDEQREAVKWE